MYVQVEKPKEKKCRAVSSAIGQKKSKLKQGFGFVDNRHGIITQRKVQHVMQRRPWDIDNESYGKESFVDKERQWLYFPSLRTIYDLKDDSEVKETLSPKRILEVNEEVKEDNGEGYDIPKIIHFYWAGKDIDQSKIDIINQWTDRAKNTGWHIFLWHDGAVRSAQGVEEGKGPFSGNILIQKITPKNIDDKLRPYYEKLVDEKNYPAASDLARYSILQEYGGIYADIDIAPGDIDLTKSIKIHSEIPIKFGPQLRDEQVVRNILKVEGQEDVTKEMIDEAARIRRKDGSFGNHFILSPKNSDIMKLLINKIVKDLKTVDIKDLEGSAAAITGQGAIAKHISKLLEVFRRKYMDEMAIADKDLLDRVFDQLVTSLPLDWVTPESSNQSEN